ncbi:hypothetical protein ACE6H2_004417 [Prunus campanulata]
MKQRFRTQSIWEREKEIDLIRLEKVSLPLYAFASSHSFFLSFSFFLSETTHGGLRKEPKPSRRSSKRATTNKQKPALFIPTPREKLAYDRLYITDYTYQQRIIDNRMSCMGL